MWTIIKSLSNLLQYCFCFMFWFFGPKACGILAPQPGIKPSPPAFKGNGCELMQTLGDSEGQGSLVC